MKEPSAEPNRNFAERVARLQLDRGLSNRALATRAKLGLDELGQILRGDCQIQLDTIFLLAGALGVEPAELLEGIAWVPDEEEGGGEYRLENPGGD
jgi:transcriptional regulator with XRE-family HTH domain